LIDFHTTVTVGSLSFYALNAGHVLGACMYMLTFGASGRSLLYTGDYSMEDDRHLMAAEIPDTSPDLLIVESTYGVQVHASRAEREARFTGTIDKIVTRGGRCLIPVFALGRAQELLLLLDEYWQAHPHLQGIPIWYASKLASRALRVYQTYANMMNARIRAQMDISNPFRFRHIQNLKSIDVNSFDDSGPCVIFASPGMLQSGVSRQLFDRWASDPKNGVLIAGYVVENTLAKDIMMQPKEVVTLEGRQQPLNCLVDYVSFSAHVDFVQNRGFINKVAPKHIILVHGQKDEMGRLKSALLLQYKQYPEVSVSVDIKILPLLVIATHFSELSIHYRQSKRPTITMPPNLQEVKLRFSRRRSAKVMGSLAERETEPKEGEEVKGILVTHNFTSKIVAPADLATFTPLRLGSIASKLHVPFAGSLATLRLFFHEMFSTVQETTVEDADGVATRFVLGTLPNTVTVTLDLQQVATVEWDASPSRDVLADAVVALLMHAQSSAASVRLTSQPCRHDRPMDTNDDWATTTKKVKVEAEDDDNDKSEASVMASRLRFLYATLKEQFQHVEAVYDEAAYKGTYEIVTEPGLSEVNAVGDDNHDDNNKDDGKLRCVVSVEFDSSLAQQARVTVECRDEKFGKHVQLCMRNIATSLLPIQI
jgi:cleavage and polyadenylation specificity factor subunit 3